MRSKEKIKTLEEAKKIVDRWKKDGKKIVEVTGCFDILHPGHIYQLEFAKSLGDYLMISLTGDKIIKKGPHRPFLNENARAEIIAALNCVDMVFINNQGLDKNILELLKPDIYVKGKEYEKPCMAPLYDIVAKEKELVESYGGKFVLSEIVEDVFGGKYSSTKFIDKVISHLKEKDKNQEND